MDVVVMSRNDFEGMLNDLKDDIAQNVEEQLIKAMYPSETKGYQDIAKLLNISANTIKARVQNGTYKPNIHYFRKDNTKHSNIHFYRDAMIDFEKSKKKR